MKTSRTFSIVFCFFFMGILTFTACGTSKKHTLHDVPPHAPSVPRKILCDGAGAVRLIVYLGCADRITGVEQIEIDHSQRVPYRIAVPALRELPVTGESHGRQNIEAILSLKEKPEQIFRSKNTNSGIDSETLQSRTGLPVTDFQYGDLGKNRETLFASLRLLGKELGVPERAEEVIAFIEKNIQEIHSRCPNLPEDKIPSVFLGGLSFRGTHGFASTSSLYEPFEWAKARNSVSSENSMPGEQMMVTREQILAWNPDFLFLDLATADVQGVNGIEELRTDPIYRELKAVKNGNVFALYPNSSYQANFEARLINAWFIAKTLYPKEFADVEINSKAREIFQFMTGVSVLDSASEFLREQAFQPIQLETRP